MSQLEIKDLTVEIDGKEILKGLSLNIDKNEIHALMGPNGNGKSTLLAAVMGNPKFTVTGGSITFEGQDVLAMSVDERSRAGLFLGMQYPQEVAGVTNSDFLRAAMNARREKPIPLFTFIREMEGTVKDLQMKPDLAHRFLNEGFSGGEKKRNEIVQMKMLKPSFAMLDEIDSGLDVDALKVVADAINDVREESKMGMMVVSHYARFYNLLKPTHAHVLVDGRIVVSGGPELVDKIDTEGYDWIEKEYGVKVSEEAEKTKTGKISIGACAAQVKKGA